MWFSKRSLLRDLGFREDSKEFNTVARMKRYWDFAYEFLRMVAWNLSQVS